MTGGTRVMDFMIACADRDSHIGARTRMATGRAGGQVVNPSRMVNKRRRIGMQAFPVGAGMALCTVAATVSGNQRCGIVHGRYTLVARGADQYTVECRGCGKLMAGRACVMHHPADPGVIRIDRSTCYTSCRSSMAGDTVAGCVGNHIGMVTLMPADSMAACRTIGVAALVEVMNSADSRRGNLRIRDIMTVKAGVNRRIEWSGISSSSFSAAGITVDPAAERSVRTYTVGVGSIDAAGMAKVTVIKMEAFYDTRAGNSMTAGTGGVTAKMAGVMPAVY